ncbi:hypothetical protein DLJ54_05835 [Corynebacterium heidelbergense]|uniref:HTH deoR-type domain-containing protein n=2 Tax=Corynebacterium heidelbergense TaxID=2055947 RepID=A0A364V5L3_9CORY|nr:hypothetical protein DLJ54_05835 [Corynebacterium heidelbergense]
MCDDGLMTSPTHRAIALLSLFSVAQCWSGAALADRLGVSPRTIRRDVNRLRDMGFPIEAEQGPEGGYRLRTGGDHYLAVLDDAQSVSVAVALLQAAAGAPVTSTADSLRAIETLRHLLPSSVLSSVKSVHAASGTVDVGWNVPPDTRLIAELAAACNRKVRVRFRYCDSRGRVSSRDVEPLRILTTGNAWYCVSFDLNRQALRSFRLDRITELTVTTFRAERRDLPDPVRYLQQNLTETPRWPVWARVRYLAPLEMIVGEVPRLYGSCRSAEDGTTEVTAGAEDWDALAGHLALIAIKLGVTMQPISPPEFSDALVRIGRRITSFGAP